MNNIKNTIGWSDYSWNPITGCSPASEGCEHCFAAAISKRFNLPWGAPVFHPERLGEPLKLKRPARIFVCSMSDMFHGCVRLAWIDQILEVMAACPQHTFIVLTKRPENIDQKLYDTTPSDPCRELGAGDYLPNLWLGVSAENQARTNERVPVLMRIPAAKRVVSVEPMLSPVHFGWCAMGWPLRIDMPIGEIDWVIAGPENGAGKRPCNDEWIDDLARQCEGSSVPFYDKRKNYIRREWPV